MREAEVLIERCRKLGATLTPLNDRIRVEAPQPLPDDLVAELKEAKPEILAELQRQQESRLKPGTELLEQWRAVAIPEWRKILREAREDGNARREEYARWMLREILKDPDYLESQP